MECRPRTTGSARRGLALSEGAGLLFGAQTGHAC